MKVKFNWLADGHYCYVGSSSLPLVEIRLINLDILGYQIDTRTLNGISSVGTLSKDLKRVQASVERTVEFLILECFIK